MYDRDRYLHFDFNLSTYCCKTERPERYQATRWILEYGLPGVNELGLEYQELIALRNELKSFIKHPYLFRDKRQTKRMDKLKSKFKKFDHYCYTKLQKFSGQFNALKEFDDFETQFFGSFEDEYEYKYKRENEDKYQDIYIDIKHELLPKFK